MLSRASCVTSEKALSLSEPQLPHPLSKAGGPCLQGLQERWTDNAWHEPGPQDTPKHAASFSSRECLELTCPIQWLLAAHGDLNFFS